MQGAFQQPISIVLGDHQILGNGRSLAFLDGQVLTTILDQRHQVIAILVDRAISVDGKLHLSLGGVQRFIRHLHRQRVNAVVAHLSGNAEAARATGFGISNLDEFFGDIFHRIIAGTDKLHRLGIEVDVFKCKGNLSLVLVCTASFSNRMPINAKCGVFNLGINGHLLRGIGLHLVGGLISIIDGDDIVSISAQSKGTCVVVHTAVSPGGGNRGGRTAVLGNRYLNILSIEVCLANGNGSLNVSIIVSHIALGIHGIIVTDLCSGGDIIHNNTLCFLVYLRFHAGTVGSSEFHGAIELVIAAQQHFGNFKRCGGRHTILRVTNVCRCNGLVNQLGIDRADTCSIEVTIQERVYPRYGVLRRDGNCHLGIVKTKTHRFQNCL